MIDGYAPGVLIDEEIAPVEVAPEPDAIEKLLLLAQSSGDMSGAWSESDLATLGARCVEDYERDKSDREDWAKIVERAQESAAQEKRGEKDYPWAKASNVHYPLLTVAALQFNARAYPAIVKGDEAISVKVVGADKGKPLIGPDGQPVMQPAGMGHNGGPPMADPGQPPPMEPVWRVKPGEKARRALRVKDYLNSVLFYRMEDWESDTDALLMDLPIVGCAFRKVWYDPRDQQQHAAMVPALRLIVPVNAKSCDTAPRMTEELPEVYPYQINQSMRAGFYRTVELHNEADDKEQPRLLLEQHRLIDVDDDGLAEPYIVTIDHCTRKVLRIEANFSAKNVRLNDAGEAVSIKRGKFYVKYDFFPHPQGKFYGIGLGHLLDQIGGVINTAINQLVDAGHAQIAGGGFIASGIRLQAAGRRSDIRYVPGEYKTVDVSGDQLRNGIVERTVPQPSPVMIQVLDMMLAAARDISSVKDVITGEASNNGQVGTTLALIEQGLQVFTAIYKRVYRSLREEFGLIYENISRFGGETAAEDYAELLDDPDANFEADFNADDMDIRPVSDPASVTRMQKMAKAQFLMQFLHDQRLDGAEVYRRIFEAADIEDADKLFGKPSQPDPIQMAGAQAELAKTQASAAKDAAAAVKTNAEAVGIAFQNGVMMGDSGAALGGGIPGVESGPGDPMGIPGGGPVQ